MGLILPGHTSSVRSYDRLPALEAPLRAWEVTARQEPFPALRIAHSPFHRFSADRAAQPRPGARFT
ncbi:hypothetical protein GCM10018987_25140 [Streptomyces cremeus]